MPCTPEDRKKKLGFGGLSRIAHRTKRSLGHVSQVNKNPIARPDPKVVSAIAREILKADPKLTESEIWPELQSLEAAVA